MRRRSCCVRCWSCSHGISSNDTFSTVFRTREPAAFTEVFARFATAFAAIGQGDVIAVDGKSMKRAWQAIGAADDGHGPGGRRHA